LSSTILQLLSQRADIPKNILDAYKKSARGTLQPSINDLLEMFHEVLNVFEDIYLVIDALDECPKAEQSREHLLEILDKIMGWKEESLHILITSRRGTDIQDPLSNYASELQNYFSIIVEEDNLDLDIQAFLRSSLNSRSFSRWNEELKTEAISTLSGRAQGMYERSTSLLYLSLT
jgi:ankyrin repeat domain-containing protein 50